MKKNEEFNPVAQDNTPFTNVDYNAEQTTAVAAFTMDEDSRFIANLTSRETTFCSLVANTPAE